MTQDAADCGAKIAALVLAAGQSLRAGATNKLLAEIAGVALIRRTVETILASPAHPVIVVTGHEAGKLSGALDGLDVEFAHNPVYAAGMAGSIAVGVKALPADVAGVLVCLGDMPSLDAGDIAALIAAFDPEHGTTIVVPVAQGRQGNPVLFGRTHFGQLMELTGDAGARSVIAAHKGAVAEVAMTGDGTLTDLDTTDAIARFNERTGGR
jgi:molybdenum cofactor cytidylyltransferase